MHLQLIEPALDLRPYIKTYWYLIGGCEDVMHRQTIVPNGRMGLCFYRNGALEYEGLGKYRSALGGQSLKSLTICSSYVEAIGVEFQPYGVRRFFAIPSVSFLGNVYKPEDLSDKGLLELENQILQVLQIEQCWELLDRFFLKRLATIESDDLNFRRILAALLAARTLPGITVEGMAENANLSIKQFRRIFEEYVGILPKGYLRIQRHQCLMSHLLEEARGLVPHITLEELSLKYGYSSPAHLITDFRDIMGYNPSEVLNQHEPDSYSWVDIETTSIMNK